MRVTCQSKPYGLLTKSVSLFNATLKPACGVQGRRRLADSDEEEEEEEEEYEDEEEEEAEDVGDEAVARRLQSQLNAGARSRAGGGGGPSRATRHAAKVLPDDFCNIWSQAVLGACLPTGCLWWLHACTNTM